MQQQRNRLVVWRIIILGFILATVILVGATAIYQDKQFKAGWAAFRSGDYATALREWRPLAEHGHVKAQHNLGSMYLKGQGVPRDYTKGEVWTRKAAEQGRAIAQYNLGWMYHHGRGVPRDYAEAAKWYRMAAEQNEAEAQTNLGILYLQGQGVPQDETEAHKWFILAATQGSKRAVELRDNSAKRLTPARLAEAQQLARVRMQEHGEVDVVQRNLATVVQSVAVATDTILARIVAPVSRLKSAPPIVGGWQSAPVLGQLGLIQLTMMFNEDGSITRKVDFISFPSVQPELEYFWDVSKGTYSMDGNEVTVKFGGTWAFLKKRGEDETIGPKQGKGSTQVFRLEEGKLVTKDLVLTRSKEVDPGELATWKRIAGYSERTDSERRKDVDPGELAAWERVADSSERADFERFLEDYPDGHFADRAKGRLAALILPPSPAPADPSVQPAVGVYPKTSEEISFSLTRTFLNPTPAAGDYFGFWIAISGDKVLIGASRDDTGAKDSGAAYLFDAAAGDLLHTFLNPTPAVDARFGGSVAISGDKVLVGAGLDDAGARDSGAAYMFDAATGDLLHTFLKPTPALGDIFGGSVAISGDKVLVGAELDDAGARDSGAAYLFDAATGDLLHTFLNPTPAVGDNFGGSVAISGDKVLVAAVFDDAGGEDSGTAYLFDVATGDLLHTFLNPTPAVGDYFGGKIAISGDKALVAAWRDDTGATDSGAVYLFDAVTGNLLHTFLDPTPGVGDNFGSGIAISGDKVLIGASWFDAATGNLLHTFLNPTPAVGDSFGSGIAISGDKVLIGAWRDDAGAKNSGAAYLFSPVPTNPR